MRAGRPSASNTNADPKRRGSKGSSNTTTWKLSGEEVKGDTTEASPQAGHTDHPFRNSGFGVQSGDCSEVGGTGISNGHTRPVDGVFHSTEQMDAFPSHGAVSISNGVASDYLSHPDLFNGAAMPNTGDRLPSVATAGFPLDLEDFVNDYNWSVHETQLLGTQHSSCSSMSEASRGQKTGKPFALVTPGQRSLCEVFPVSTGHASPKKPANGVELKSLSTSQVNLGDTMEWEGGSNGLQILSQDPTSIKAQDEDHAFSAIEPVSSQSDIQHRRMQELSELAMTLYSQVVETGSREEAAPAHNLLHDLTGKVLKSSVKFLRLLTSSYLTKAAQSSSHPPQESSTEEDISPAEASDFRFSPSCDTLLTTPAWERSTSQDCSSTLCSGMDEAKPQQVDMTEVFSLLTCYIRILNLHSRLYSQFSDFLASSSERGANMPPIIPGIQVGGVSLDDFGRFQIKFLLQVSTHVLGEIEMALGLPDGHRISKKDRQRHGILEGSVSTQFIEMTMGERGKTGMGMEKDKVTSIRNHIASLRQLLKGTINP